MNGGRRGAGGRPVGKQRGKGGRGGGRRGKQTVGARGRARGGGRTTAAPEWPRTARRDGGRPRRQAERAQTDGGAVAGARVGRCWKRRVGTIFSIAGHPPRRMAVATSRRRSARTADVRKWWAIAVGFGARETGPRIRSGHRSHVVEAPVRGCVGDVSRWRDAPGPWRRVTLADHEADVRERIVWHGRNGACETVATSPRGGRARCSIPRCRTPPP